MKPWIRFATGTLSLLAAYPASAAYRSAQQVLRTSVDYTQSVSQRPVDVFPANFTRLGSWKLYPQLEVTEMYDDNVYAAPTDTQEDFITDIKPRARLVSDWNVHSIQLEVGGNLGFYKDFTDENYQDYFAVNQNRFEIIRSTYLTTDLIYRHEHAARTSPNNVEAATDPLEYDILSGRFGIERSLGKLGLRVDAGFEKLTYEDSRSATDVVIDNSDMDRLVSNFGIRLSYQPVPDAEAYLRLGVNDTSYDDSRRNGGPDRDNSGFDVTLGFSKAVSDLWVLDAYVGYSPGYYADPSLQDITGSDAFVMGASLLWNPTPLTSVIGNLDRRTYQTTVEDATALVRTSFSLKVEHKLTRSLLLDAGVGYHHDDYAGSERTDDNYIATLGAEYFLTKLMSVRLAYNYRERDSNTDTAEYDKNSVFLQLRVNY